MDTYGTCGVPAQGVRIGWPDLPLPVRAEITRHLSAPVRTVNGQRGGFSPGLAARVTCADGARFFLKATSDRLGPDGAEYNRNEARVLRAMPVRAPVPRLRAVVDDGDWVCLIVDDVDGRQPRQPWRPTELLRVLAELTRLNDCVTPADPAITTTFAETYEPLFTGWPLLRQYPPADLDPWVEDNLDRLSDITQAWRDGVHGDGLVHADLRADNVLIAGEQTYFVDWAWGCRGAGWVDVLMLLASVSGCSPAWLDRLVARHPLTAPVPAYQFDALLGALAGMYAWRCRLPPVPGLPTLRPWQREQAALATRWLRRRLAR